ncbi:MAG: hypothetical protein M5U27_11800 [Gaiella sp.]|nr:hypothetical protein [Gaiella sp.]
MRAAGGFPTQGGARARTSLGARGRLRAGERWRVPRSAARDTCSAGAAL